MTFAQVCYGFSLWSPAMQVLEQHSRPAIQFLICSYLLSKSGIKKVTKILLGQKEKKEKKERIRVYSPWTCNRCFYSSELNYL